MSSGSSNQEQSSKNSKKDKDDKLEKSKTNITASESQAGTSKSLEADRKKSKNKNEKNNWGFFPQNMWFWKQEEPQQEVQIKNWSTSSEHSVSESNEIPQPHSPKQLVIKTESQYIWPETLNIRGPRRLANQPTLDQIIEQRKLRENQLIFAEDFNKNVDYLGDRLSKTKLNILFAQLNEILPSTSDEHVDSTKKLTRAKPLRVASSQQLNQKASKVSEHLKPEEIKQREQLRQNQLQECENLRDQIDLFEGRSSFRNLDTPNAISKETNEHIMDETISKTDLNKLIDLLNEIPSVPKENMDTSLQELLKAKPQIMEVIKKALKKISDRLIIEEKSHESRQTQIQEFENVRDQIALYEDRSVPMNVTTANKSMNKMSATILKETLPKTKLKNPVIQQNKPESFQKPTLSKLFRWKTSERLTPEELARREKLRQNQLQEYENLREQIGLFGERRTDVTAQDRKEIVLEKTISKQELHLFINQLNELPQYLKK